MARAEARRRGRARSVSGMYEAFYGLEVKPFSLLPDAEFLYLGKTHKLALQLLEYGLTEQTGIVVISGEIGAGKTTLIRRLLQTVSDETVIGLLTNTHPSFEMMRWVAAAFELESESTDSLTLHEAFLEYLVALYASGRRAVLIVDEAQNLSLEALEELRMLSNINTDKDYLLQIILVGQPELLATLNNPRLRQLVQRVGISYHLSALDLGETIRYIRHRLEVAGGDRRLFDDLACATVHYYSGGVPRLINLLCDLALVYGYAEDRQRIDIDTVIEVAAARESSGLTAFRASPDGAGREEVKQLIRRSLLSAVETPSAEVGAKPTTEQDRGGR
jgi:general secretion pathway protein A